MSTFYLIRHAHAEWTPDERRPLSSRGHKDARRMAEMLCDLQITRIYSSPFQRALQTVAPLATIIGLPIHQEPDLRERKLGDAPGVYDFFTAVMKTWQDPAFSYQAGETNAAAQLRGVAVVQRLRDQYPAGNLVLSTHGNLIALVLQRFDPSIDFTFWKAMTMPYIYVLNLSQIDKPTISRLWRQR